MKIHPHNADLYEPIEIPLRIVNADLAQRYVGKKHMLQEQASTILANLDRSRLNERLHITGPLCNKPGVVSLDLLQLQEERLTRIGFARSGRVVWNHVTGDARSGVDLVEKIPPGGRLVSKVRFPDWSSKGFSSESPGFVLWFSPFGRAGAFCGYGQNLAEKDYWAEHFQKDIPAVSAVHLFSHRYVKKRKKLLDLVEYHFGQ